ncbi:hypothetical protein [Virgibacillus salexigens]|uniref:hypothetical protein n=1 Tax=Virgibacillus salexigens TaxID=61016 RepID=UPI00190E0CD7|nr:hypothetical protein [Virgibacillus salexigens]
MNKIAESLYIIGGLCIIGGIILGVANYETVVGYQESEFGVLDPEPITETSWLNVLIYVMAGLISGVIMFGFGEIVRILDDKRSIERDSHKELLAIKQYLIKDNLLEGNDITNSINDQVKDEPIEVNYPSSFTSEDEPSDFDKERKGLSGFIDKTLNGKR